MVAADVAVIGGGSAGVCAACAAAREGASVILVERFAMVGGNATVDDLRAGRAFDDAVARGVFYLDGMRPDDEKRTYFLSKEEQRVPPYHIPFRSLIARDADNLLMAGRCLSADQPALSSARVMTTCAMMGQAAGIAAAWSAAGGCSPRDINGIELRRQLEQYGVNFNIWNGG